MTYGPKPKTFAERFWPKVDFSGDCWVWMASHDQAGYGRFATSRRTWANSHRIAYELLVGPIPAGLHLDHLCRNRACVNPDHLEPVTQRENTLRGVSPSAHRARQTHCKRGHEFTAENTHVDTLGRRCCRQCRRAFDRARRPSKSAVAA